VLHLLPGDGRLGHGQNDQIRAEQAVRVQVTSGDGRILMPTDDRNRPIRVDGG
jgi:hypothetical protein